MTVLLVDDNRVNQLVAASVLANLGFDVEIVGGGIEAVEACKRRTFDVVLMDIMMPHLDGYRATAEIRAHETAIGAAHTPIIGLGAPAMDGDRELALAAGLNDYLTKPLMAPALRDALRRWVGAPVVLR